MTVPEPSSTVSAVSIVGRVLAGIISAAVGVVFLFCAWVAVSSRFGIGGTDAHGYGLIFGVFLAIIAAFVVATALPLAFRRDRRRRAYTVTLVSFGVVFIALIALVVTA